MNKTTVLLLLDEIFDLKPGTLSGNEPVKEWDSLSLISLIALADERFGKVLSASQINKANTMEDIVDLLLA